MTFRKMFVFVALLVAGFVATSVLVSKLHSADKIPVDEITALKIENLQAQQQIKQFQFGQIQQQAMQLQNSYREAQSQIEALKTQAYTKAHVKPEDYMLDVATRRLIRKPKTPTPAKATKPAGKKK